MISINWRQFMIIQKRLIITKTCTYGLDVAHIKWLMIATQVA